MSTSTQDQKIRDYFLIGLLTLASILVFLLLKPYISSLLLALVLAIIFRPIFLRILKETGNREVLASILTTILILLIIVVPFVIFGALVIKEINNVVQSPSDFLNNISNTKIPELLQRINVDFKSYLQGILTGFLNDAGKIFSNLAQFFVYFILTVMSLIYLFKDGYRIRKSLLSSLPFTPEQAKKLTDDMATGIRAVIGGYLLIAVMQGFISGIGFWIFGIPNPALWGFVTILVALIPSFGTSLANIPAIAFLFFTKHTGAAIGLAIWYVVFLTIIDNYIGPKFVSGKVRIHVLLLIFSVIGGIKLFGTFGFIMGPLIMIFFWSILEMFHKQEFIEQEQPINKA